MAQVAKHLDSPILKIPRASESGREQAGLFAHSHSHYITHDIIGYLENTSAHARTHVAHNKDFVIFWIYLRRLGL